MLLGLPTLILMFGMLVGEFGIVADSAANGDLGDIRIGERLRFINCIACLEGVSAPLGLLGVCKIQPLF